MGELRAEMAFRWETQKLRLSRKRFGRYLLLYLLALLFLSALVVFLLERRTNQAMQSYGTALYMIIITIATVGYGDITPITVGGRVTIMVTLVLGIGALSAFISLMATKRTEKARRRYSGLDEKVETKNHILVCGWNNRGRFVMSRLKAELAGKRTFVILLCDQEESPLSDESIFFLRGNPVSQADLQRANAAEAKVIILLADESKGGNSSDVDARTVLTAIVVHEMNPEAKMTAEVLEPENIHHLELAGVGEILDSNSFLGNLIARSALHYGVIKSVSDMVTMEAGTRVFTLPAPPEMVGRTLAEVRASLWEERGARLLAVATTEGFKPRDDDYRIETGDFLTVTAPQEPPSVVK